MSPLIDGVIAAVGGGSIDPDLSHRPQTPTDRKTRKIRTNPCFLDGWRVSGG